MTLGYGEKLDCKERTHNPPHVSNRLSNKVIYFFVVDKIVQ